MRLAVIHLDTSELVDQHEFFPAPFGDREATLAARLYRGVPRAREREFDLAVAACALVHEAVTWTLNAGDFRDTPGLALCRSGPR